MEAVRLGVSSRILGWSWSSSLLILMLKLIKDHFVKKPPSLLREYPGFVSLE